MSQKFNNSEHMIRNLIIYLHTNPTRLSLISSLCTMEPRKGNGEVDHEFLPLIRVYKDGYVHRLPDTERVPPSIDSQTGLSSKDVIIQPETGLSARLYIPKKAISSHEKLPLLIYFHGGAFIIESAFSTLYHNHINTLISEANVVVVSVEYRLAPEHPLPIAYDDSWAAIQWVVAHSKGEGKEDWLKECCDFDRVFLAGDSAGANIVHNMAIRSKFDAQVKLLGVVLVHPYFWGEEHIGSELLDSDKKSMVDKLWPYACPSSSKGNDDPRINPLTEGAPSLKCLGCSKVLVFVAEKDILRDRGWAYYEALKKSGWEGDVKILETEGEDHVFHLFNPTCEKAITLVKSFANFLNQDVKET